MQHSALSKSTGRFWALFPVGLLGVLLAIQAVMITLATHDPGFALEPQYYQKAVAWDHTQAEKRASDRLGWQLALQAPMVKRDGELVLSLDDVRGEPVSGAVVELELFHNARASAVQAKQLSEREAGKYAGLADLSRPGIWIFRVRATRGAELFTLERRLEVY